MDSTRRSWFLVFFFSFLLLNFFLLVFGARLSFWTGIVSISCSIVFLEVFFFFVVTGFLLAVRRFWWQNFEGYGVFFLVWFWLCIDLGLQSFRACSMATGDRTPLPAPFSSALTRNVKIQSPQPSSVNSRLWRTAAQRNLRNQWSKLASLRRDWVSASSTARAHATSLVNSFLSQK